MLDISQFKRSKGLNTHETMMTVPGALDHGGTGLCGARYDKGVCLMVWQRKEPGSDSPFKDTPHFQ